LAGPVVKKESEEGKSEERKGQDRKVKGGLTKEEPAGKTRRRTPVGAGKKARPASPTRNRGGRLC
jgi:hypothetical protein